MELILSDFVMNTAVDFFVYNRLDTTQIVFERIREIKPPRLYLICDAARPAKEGDAEKVAAVREFLDTHVDWDCEVHKNYAETNMGCKNRVSSGISWVFEHEEEAIIIEDDVLLDISFFRSSVLDFLWQLSLGWNINKVNQTEDIDRELHSYLYDFHNSRVGVSFTPSYQFHRLGFDAKIGLNTYFQSNRVREQKEVSSIFKHREWNGMNTFILMSIVPGVTSRWPLRWEWMPCSGMCRAMMTATITCGRWQI